MGKTHTYDGGLKTFGNMVAMERERYDAGNGKIGITQAELAEMLGVDLDKVRNWEQGNRFPKYDDLMKLCSVFKCGVDHLLNKMGDTDYKTWTNKFICEQTGLSEKAVETLMLYLNDGYPSFCELIADLIEDSGVEIVQETWMETGITYSERMRNGGNFLYLMYQLIYKNCGPNEGMMSETWGDDVVKIFGGDIYRAWLLRLFESMSKFVEGQRKEKDMPLYRNAPFYDPEIGIPIGY